MAPASQFRINLSNYVSFRHVVGLLGQGIGPSLTSTYTNTNTTLIHSHASSEFRSHDFSVRVVSALPQANWNLLNSDSAYWHSAQNLSFLLLLSKNENLRFSRLWPWRMPSYGIWRRVDIVNRLFGGTYRHLITMIHCSRISYTLKMTVL
jgi:hypothetical protein